MFRALEKSRMRPNLRIVASATWPLIVSILLVQVISAAAAAATANETHNHQHHHQHQQQRHQRQSNHQQQQQQVHSTAYDEEINFEPQYDYDKTSASGEDGAALVSQIAPDLTNQALNDASLADEAGEASSGGHRRHSSAAQLANSGQISPTSSYNGDPFAATFEEYLREANLQSAHHASAATDDDVEPQSAADGLVADGAAATALPNKAAASNYQPDERDSAESDDSTAKQFNGNGRINNNETPIIDYIFPPPAPAAAETNKQQLQQQDEHHRAQNDGTINATATTLTNPTLTGPAASLLNEIKLLFAWKQLPTSKCSKTCGKGNLINNLFCVDMKFDVRVEDELCLKSGVPKPNETSDEPCNQIDCPPQWISIELQQQQPHSCNQSAAAGAHSDICRPNLHFKRVQCAMVDKAGATIYLDDSRCVSNEPQSSKSADKQQPQPQPQFDDESVELSIESQVDSQRNDILSNIDPADSNWNSLLTLEHGNELSTQQHQQQQLQHPHNEPFFEAGPWSGCFGSRCGQLGRRHRKLECKIYLSRSARYAELPEASCQGAAAPDTQEPCYLDCGQPEQQAQNATTGEHNNHHHNHNHNHRHPHPTDNHVLLAEQSPVSAGAAATAAEGGELISVVGGVNIEQRSTHVVLTDVASGRKEVLTMEQLAGMPLKLLIKTLIGFSKEAVTRIKQLRRALRSSRAAAAATGGEKAPPICRSKRLGDQAKSKLERRNAELMEESRRKDGRIAELERRLLSCECDNSILIGP